MQLVPDWVVGQFDYGAPNLSFALRARHFATSQNKPLHPITLALCPYRLPIFGILCHTG